MNVAHVCRFTAGLDDLTQREQKNVAAVLRRLHEIGRFSVFEATANKFIAETMDHCKARGYFTIDNDSCSFPWSKVTLTEAGKKVADL